MEGIKSVVVRYATGMSPIHLASWKLSQYVSDPFEATLYDSEEKAKQFATEGEKVFKVHIEIDAC